LNYFICTGIDPSENQKHPPNQYAIGELGSMLLHAVIYIRIKIYKIKFDEHSQSRSTLLKARCNTLFMHMLTYILNEINIKLSSLRYLQNDIPRINHSECDRDCEQLTLAYNFGYKLISNFTYDPAALKNFAQFSTLKMHPLVNFTNILQAALGQFPYSKKLQSQTVFRVKLCKTLP